MNTDKHKQRIVYPETYFVVDYEWNYGEEGNCHWVDYTVYRIESIDEENTKVECEDEVFAKGFVKWDGCTEFSVERNHLCGFYEIKQFQQLFTDIYYKVSDICKVEFKDLD